MPIKIGNCEIKNRTSLAPTEPLELDDDQGGFSSKLQNFYVDKTALDIGLIITEVTSVDLSLDGIQISGLSSPTYNPLKFIHSTYPMN